MEVSLLAAQGLPEGCLLSVRVGTTRRQGPAVPETLKLRFPKGFRGVDNFKVDVLAPVGSKTVELEGAGKYDVLVGSDPHHQVLLDVAEIDREAGPLPNMDKAFASSALPKGTVLSDSESPSASRRHRAALSARQYLDEHKLLGWAQTLFQDLIRSRPKDPWGFIDEQTRLAKKLAETERRKRPEEDDEQPHADVAALTMPMKINRIAEGVLSLGKQLQDRMKELEEEAESGTRRKDTPAEALQEISEGLSALSRELALRVQQLEEGGLWMPLKKAGEYGSSSSSSRHAGATGPTLEAIAETPTEVAETPYSPTLASRSLRSSAPPTPALPPTLERPEEEEACEAKAVAPGPEKPDGVSSQQLLSKDANKDGVVDEAEMAAEPKSLQQELFEVLDKDGDGQLSKEEILEGMKAMDADGDGIVTEEELKQGIAAAKAAKAEEAAVLANAPQKAEEAFAIFDKDGDGEVTKEEFEKGMEKMAQVSGAIHSSEPPAEVFDKFDADGDGIVTQEEFAAGMTQMAEEVKAQEEAAVLADAPNNVEEAFAIFDKDGDGEVTKEEFEQGMEKLAEATGVVESSQTAAEAFDMFDEDGDGIVTKDEFEKGMQKLESLPPVPTETSTEPTMQDVYQKFDAAFDAGIKKLEGEAGGPSLAQASGDSRTAHDALFDMMDKDGNGEVDPQEFVVGIQQLAQVQQEEGGNEARPDVPTAEEAQQIFEMMDADGDGVVTADEFAEGMKVLAEQKEADSVPTSPATQPDVAKGLSADLMLSMMDKNGDGVVDPQEFAEGMAAMAAPPPMPEPQAKPEEPEAAEKAAPPASPLGMSALTDASPLLTKGLSADLMLSMMDKNGDGVVDPQEYAAGMAMLASPSNPLPEDASPQLTKGLSADLMLSMMDKNGDGVVDPQEFAAGMLEMSQPSNPLPDPTMDESPQLTKGISADLMLSMMDKNGDGVVDPQEFAEGMASLAGPPPMPEPLDKPEEAEAAGKCAAPQSPAQSDGEEPLDNLRDRVRLALSQASRDNTLEDTIGSAREAVAAEKTASRPTTSCEEPEPSPGLSPEQMLKTLDKDGDGVVSVEEMREAMKELPFASPPETPAAAATEPEAEAAPVSEEPVEPLPEVEIAGGVMSDEVFAAMDIDKSGKVDAEEFEAGLEAMGLVLDTPESPAAVSSGDVVAEGDDTVSPTRVAAANLAEIAAQRSLDGRVEDESLAEKVEVESQDSPKTGERKSLKQQLFEVLDKDGDGDLTQEELQEGLKAMDADGDGILTEEEIKEGIRKAQEAKAAKEAEEERLKAEAAAEPVTAEDLYELLDKDGDGQLTQEEVMEGMKALDTDGDGIVSEEELRAGIQAMKEAKAAEEAVAAAEVAQPSADGRQAPPPADDAATTLADTAGFSDADAGANWLLMSREAGRVPSSSLSVSDADAAGTEMRSTQRDVLATIQASQDSRLEEPVGATAFDQDGDGNITQSEIAAAAGAMDADGDGVITQQEMADSSPVEEKTLQEQLFEVLDKDGDGELTREEIMEGMAAMDADGDGIVTEEELRAGIAAAQEEKAAREAEEAAQRAREEAERQAEIAAQRAREEAQRQADVAAASANEEAVREAEPEPQIPETPKEGVIGFDQDGDGNITQKEVNTALDIMDADGDGMLSKEEMVDATPVEERTLQEQLFEVLDKDGDGELTREEIVAGMAAMDADGDGIVTEEELRAGIAAAQQEKAAREAEEAAQRAREAAQRAREAAEAEPEPPLPDTPVHPRRKSSDDVSKSVRPRDGTPQEPEAEDRVDKEFSGKEALLPEALRSGTSTAAPATGSLEPHTVESFLDGSRPGTGSTPANRPGDLSEIDVLRSSVREPDLDISKSGQDEGMTLPRHAMELGRIHRQAQFEIQELRRYTREAKTDISDLHKNVRDEMKDLRGYAREARNDIFDLREQAEKVRDLLKM